MSLRTINCDSCRSDLEWITALKDESWNSKAICEIAEKIIMISDYVSSASRAERAIVISLIKNFFKDIQGVNKCMSAFKEELKWGFLPGI